jgi:hypothetical protein
MRGMRGGGGNYTVPYTAFCWTYIVILYSYIVSCYITIKHIVYYALAYMLTQYSYITSTYITIYGYTGGGVRGGACLALSLYRRIRMRLYGKAGGFYYLPR